MRSPLSSFATFLLAVLVASCSSFKEEQYWCDQLVTDACSCESADSDSDLCQDARDIAEREEEDACEVFYTSILPEDCRNSTGGSGSGGSGDGDGGPPDDPSCERPHYGLTDLSDDFSEWTCDVQEATGVEAVGATSFFYGVYKQAGGSYSGYEEWHLFANDSWSDSGGSDCVMRWNLTATESTPVTCSGCDLALDVILTFDEECSTCPESLTESEIGTSYVRYELQTDSDGDTRWFFGESGNEFGQGTSNANALNFATDASCRWF